MHLFINLFIHSFIHLFQLGDEEGEGPNFFSVDEEVSIREEPTSPASSVSSKLSETGGKLHIRPRKKKGNELFVHIIIKHACTLHK